MWELEKGAPFGGHSPSVYCLPNKTGWISAPLNLSAPHVCEGHTFHQHTLQPWDLERKLSEWLTKSKSISLESRADFGFHRHWVSGRTLFAFSMYTCKYLVIKEDKKKKKGEASNSYGRERMTFLITEKVSILI